MAVGRVLRDDRFAISSATRLQNPDSFRFSGMFPVQTPLRGAKRRKGSLLVELGRVDHKALVGAVADGLVPVGDQHFEQQLAAVPLNEL